MEGSIVDECILLTFFQYIFDLFCGIIRFVTTVIEVSRFGDGRGMLM
jgi:hypothetical protein